MQLKKLCTLVILNLVTYSLNVGAWADTFGVAYPLPCAVACSLGSSIVYAGDRLRDMPQESRSVMRGIIVLFSMCMAAIDWFYGHIVINACLLCVPVLFYAAPMPLVHVSIKRAFPFSKTLFVPLVHVLWFAHAGNISAQTLLATNTVSTCAMYVHFALVTITMDIKDITKDTANDVITVPVVAGRYGTFFLLLAADCGISCVLRVFGWRLLSTLFALDFVLNAVYSIRDWTPTNTMLLTWCLLLRTAQYMQLDTFARV